MDPVDAIGWVHVRDGRLLTVRSRRQGALYLPGGKREPGESDWSALAREVAEEVGLTLLASSLALVGVFTAQAHGYPDGRLVRLACYAASPVPVAAVPRAAAEITELVWLGAAGRDRCAPALRLLVDDLVRAGTLAPP